MWKLKLVHGAMCVWIFVCGYGYAREGNIDAAHMTISALIILFLLEKKDQQINEFKEVARKTIAEIKVQLNEISSVQEVSKTDR